MYLSINIDRRVYVAWLIRYSSSLTVIILSLKQINQYSINTAVISLYIYVEVDFELIVLA